MYYFYAPIDPCLEVNCGKHSKCEVEGTEAFCVCAEGWTYNPKEISAGCVGKLILNRIWCMPPPPSASSALHSSEIRSLRSTLCSSKTLRNLLCFMYKKTHVVFSFRATLFSPLMNALVYVDQGIHWGKK